MTRPRRKADLPPLPDGQRYVGAWTTPHCDDHLHYVVPCEACAEACENEIRRGLSEARGYIATVHEIQSGGVADDDPRLDG